LQSQGELSSPGAAPPGLRERKKARTRAAIQRHALRLFRKQGYDETTVSQIAEAAEVSESTFFRYFPSKEDVVLWDEFDPHVADVFLAQPPGTRPIEAVRTAVREVLGQLGPDQQADLRERMELMMAVPELRTNLLEQIASPMLMFGQVVAQRTGRRPDDPAVRAFVGAIMGVSISTMFAFAEDPSADMFTLLDQALVYLEEGLPL
jgi:AcrR family transcriptional regulator